MDLIHNIIERKLLLRWQLFYCLFIMLLLQCSRGNCQQQSSADNSTKRNLYIGGIFPMTGSWAGGQGCRPAVDMALRDVNNHSNLLTGYNLEMVANDTQVI